MHCFLTTTVVIDNLYIYIYIYITISQTSLDVKKQVMMMMMTSGNRSSSSFIFVSLPSLVSILSWSWRLVFMICLVFRPYCCCSSKTLNALIVAFQHHGQEQRFIHPTATPTPNRVSLFHTTRSYQRRSHTYHKSVPSFFSSSSSSHHLSVRPSMSRTTKIRKRQRVSSSSSHKASSSSYSSSIQDDSDSSSKVEEENVVPQIIATGYSSQADWKDAIQEATFQALDSLPFKQDVEYILRNTTCVDFAFFTISSLYEISPSLVVPTIVEAIRSCPRNRGYTDGISTFIGCSSGGVISSQENIFLYDHSLTSHPQSHDHDQQRCKPLEQEGLPGFSISLCLLPNTTLNTFHIQSEDIPDDDDDDVGSSDDKDRYYYGTSSSDQDTWRKLLGMQKSNKDRIRRSNPNNPTTTTNTTNTPIVMVLPSPSFQRNMDTFLRGLTSTLGSDTIIFGATASTVSSLSRARLFRFDVEKGITTTTTALSDGCIGIVMQGDIQAKILVAQGAKPVGPIYRVISARDSTLRVIQMDETATEQLKQAKGLDYDRMEDVSEDNDSSSSTSSTTTNNKDQRMAAYAKASIPKPVLAEANFLLKTLSDDDQVFMKKVLLIGFERSSGWIPNSPNELIRLQEGQGHRFTVYQVASAGMKDGSVTFPLGSVKIEPGTRLRFFVRDGPFARKEVEALWMGYKKEELNAQLLHTMVEQGSDGSYFSPTGCFLFPTLDRGSKLFGGRDGYESKMITKFIPSITSISGFFANGIIGKLDPNDTHVMTIGSASCYVLFGSKTKRPIYSAAIATRNRIQADHDRMQKEAKVDDDKDTEMGNVLMNYKSRLSDQNVRAPRAEDGELILRRREVHSGRALTVSSVEWSVAEKSAKPTSVLEGYMWDKETEVDRFRERVPLSNLMSQCKLRNADPSSPRPRDWIGSIKLALQDGNPFVSIPEIKRIEPSFGTLRKRYNVGKIAKQLTLRRIPAICVNCDAIMYGGSVTDISEARDASTKAVFEMDNIEDGVVVPPILASDLILYPYQLYKLYLAGADAVKLLVGALSGKDLLYLCKIASSLRIQCALTVTSEEQIRRVLMLDPEYISALIVSNLNLEDFTYDSSGNQALKLLECEALKEAKASLGKEFPIFVDFRLIPEMSGELSVDEYNQNLLHLGVTGSITNSLPTSDD